MRRRPGQAEDLLRALQQADLAGETIVTEGWRTDDKIIVRAATKERPSEHIFTNAYAELENA